MAQNPAPIRPRVKDARDYEQALRRAYLNPFIGRILQRLAVATGTTDVFRALDRELEALIARPQAGVPIEMIAAQVDRVDGYHRQRLIQTFRAALGVDVRMFLSRPTVAAYLQERIAENVSLIKTIPPRFHEGLKASVSAAFAAAPFDQQQLRTLFAEEYRSAGYNLRRLTRDQTNKQVGGLSRLRHSQLGITRFIWRTVQDERVRSSHAGYEGNTYLWSDAPEGGPGIPIQCRCVSEPSLGPAELDRLGAKVRVTKPRTPKQPAELTPQQARSRFKRNYKQQGEKLGLPKAEKELRAAKDDYDKALAFRNDWYKNEGKPGFTTAERVRRDALVTEANRKQQAARSRYAQVRLDTERAAWRDVFGDRKPGVGMDTEILGRPSDAFQVNVNAAAQDFRRMVHGDNLQRIGKVEIKGTPAGKGSWGDAGIAYTDPRTGKERYGGMAGGPRGKHYGRFSDSRRRIRVDRGEPGETHFTHNDPAAPWLRGGLTEASKLRGSATTVHELGHQLEDAYPEMLKAADAFIRKRGKKFDWINDYAEREYRFQGQVSSTELVSVGLEQLYTRPAEFARRDPEYFDWIWQWVVRAKGE